MTSSVPKIAIYSCPNPKSNIYKILTKLQGYNPFTKEKVEPDSEVLPYLGASSKFGPHITLQGVFTPKDYNKIKVGITQFATTLETFKYNFTNFTRLERSQLLRNANIIPALVLPVDNNAKDTFVNIHMQVIEITNPYRVGIEELWKDSTFKNDPEMWEHIQNYGEPYSMDYYEPHLSIATGMEEDEKLWNNLLQYLNSNYEELLRTPIVFEDIYIFEEILDGNLEGHFYVKDRIKIGTT